MCVFPRLILQVMAGQREVNCHGAPTGLTTDRMETACHLDTKLDQSASSTERW